MRTEILFPHYDDAIGQQNFGETNKWRDLLLVRLRWRRQKLKVILYKNDVKSPNLVYEWTEGNITYAHTVDNSCNYHGYVKGQKSSYVALSTCDGLVSRYFLKLFLVVTLFFNKIVLMILCI